MSRARARPSTVSTELFPFLDVLLSMMGSLILLMVVIGWHDRNRAVQKVKEAGAQVTKAQQDERDELDWRREQLIAQRDRTQADLEAKRLTLGHLEEHFRQLKTELEELKRAEGEIDHSAIAGQQEQ